MDDKVKEYRQKHKKCKYCKYLCSMGNDRDAVIVCSAKGKRIREMYPDMTSVPRWFCKCYEVNDG